MKDARHNQNDPTKRPIERGLCRGEFIHDHACFSFISGLEKVAADIQKLIPSEPAPMAGAGEAISVGAGYVSTTLTLSC
jgi:hypothetical protein